MSEESDFSGIFYNESSDSTRLFVIIGGKRILFEFGSKCASYFNGNIESPHNFFEDDKFLNKLSLTIPVINDDGSIPEKGHRYRHFEIIFAKNSQQEEEIICFLRRKGEDSESTPIVESMNLSLSSEDASSLVSHLIAGNGDFDSVFDLFPKEVLQKIANRGIPFYQYEYYDEHLECVVELSFFEDLGIGVLNHKWKDGVREQWEYKLYEEIGNEETNDEAIDDKKSAEFLEYLQLRYMFEVMEFLGSKSIYSRYDRDNILEEEVIWDEQGSVTSVKYRSKNNEGDNVSFVLDKRLLSVLDSQKRLVAVWSEELDTLFIDLRRDNGALLRFEIEPIEIPFGRIGDRDSFRVALKMFTKKGNGSEELLIAENVDIDGEREDNRVNPLDNVKIYQDGRVEFDDHDTYYINIADALLDLMRAHLLNDSELSDWLNFINFVKEVLMTHEYMGELPNMNTILNRFQALQEQIRALEFVGENSKN